MAHLVRHPPLSYRCSCSLVLGSFRVGTRALGIGASPLGIVAASLHAILLVLPIVTVALLHAHALHLSGLLLTHAKNILPVAIRRVSVISRVGRGMRGGATSLLFLTGHRQRRGFRCGIYESSEGIRRGVGRPQTPLSLCGAGAVWGVMGSLGTSRRHRLGDDGLLPGPEDDATLDDVLALLRRRRGRGMVAVWVHVGRRPRARAHGAWWPGRPRLRPRRREGSRRAHVHPRRRSLAVGSWRHRRNVPSLTLGGGCGARVRCRHLRVRSGNLPGVGHVHHTLWGSERSVRSRYGHVGGRNARSFPASWRQLAFVHSPPLDLLHVHLLGRQEVPHEGRPRAVVG